MGPRAEPVLEVVIAAAGAGARLGGDVPKAFVEVAGRPMVAHSLARAWALSPRRVAVAVPPDDPAPWIQRLRELPPGLPVEAVPGGASRQASVRAALGALREAAEAAGEPPAEVVMVHDAARPCATVALWRRVYGAAARAGAAIPVVPEADCLKRVGAGGRVEGTVGRERLFRAQTPQGFRADWLWRAHEAAAGPPAPDDAMLVERCGLPVAAVAGEATNLKVTTREDLEMAEAWLRGRGGPPGPGARVGYGYDVHPLAAGRRLVLGGVEIPGEAGLAGHSDADAVAHAVADALLGAAALGDLGRHYPDDDPRWQGADSIELLRRVAAKVREAGFRVGNVDATIIAEEPRLAPHLPAMCRRLADALGVPGGAVSVKATRAEGLGSLGRGEGIAVQAVAVLWPLG